MVVSHLKRKALSGHRPNKNFVNYARMFNADYKQLGTLTWLLYC